MNIAAGCERGGIWYCTRNNQKSTKFQFHNSVKFSNSKSGFDICKLSCSSASASASASSSSSSSSSRFSVTKKYEALDNPDPDLFLTLLCDEIPTRVYTFTILMRDDLGDLKVKLDRYVPKCYSWISWFFWKLKGFDATNKAPLVFRESALLLLNNAHLWISSRFMVATNMLESELKVIKSDQMIPNKVIAPVKYYEEQLMYHPCTEVIMELIIGGGPLKNEPIGGTALGFNYKEIHTRDDLKALLHHLMDEEEVVALKMTCRSVLLSKHFVKKTKAFKYYSHTTS